MDTVEPRGRSSARRTFQEGVKDETPKVGTSPSRRRLSGEKPSAKESQKELETRQVETQTVKLGEAKIIVSQPSRTAEKEEKKTGLTGRKVVEVKLNKSEAPIAFPEDLSQLKYVQHIQGGGGGVYVLEDSQTGKKYTLKLSSSAAQFEEEIIADALYLVGGSLIPQFAVYEGVQTLDEKVREQLKLSKDSLNKIPFVRLAEYIEEAQSLADIPLTIEMQDEVGKGFMLDVTFANWDATANSQNILLDKNGKAYRADNGGALRFRAKGGLKGEGGWEMEQLPELQTLVDSSYNNNGFIYYKTLTEAQVKNQQKDVFDKREDFLKTVDILGKALKTKEKNWKERGAMLGERLANLGKLVQPVDISKFPAEKHASATPRTAAGVFLYSKDKNGKVCVLVGSRKGTHDRKVCTLGGRSDFIPGSPSQSDGTLARTGSRELGEESMKLTGMPSTDLENQPSHDLHFNNSDLKKVRLYRLYFSPSHYVDKKVLDETLLKQTDVHSAEYHEFYQVPIEAFLDEASIKDGYLLLLDGRKLELYPDFQSMLCQKEVQAYLKELQKTGTIKERHTQSVVGQASVEEAEKIKWELPILKPADLKRHKIVPIGQDAFGRHYGKRSVGNQTEIVYYNPAKQEAIAAKAGIAKKAVAVQLKQTLSEPRIINQKLAEIFKKEEELRQARKSLNYLTERFANGQEIDTQKFEIQHAKVLKLEKDLAELQKVVTPEKLKLAVPLPPTYVPRKVYPYTTTEAHAKLTLGAEYKESPFAELRDPNCTPARAVEILSDPGNQLKYKEWLKTIIQKMLQKANVDPSKYSYYDYYVAQMVEAAFIERIYIDKIVSYHGADELTGFLYDVLTEVFKQLMSSSKPDLRIMRGILKAFEGLMNVDKLIQKFEDPATGHMSPDYIQAFQAVVISANPCLFASFNRDGMETFRFFLEALSNRPIDVQKMLIYFSETLGLPLDVKDLMAIFEARKATNPKTGGLYQYIMDPADADKLVYLSVLGETPMVKKEGPPDARQRPPTSATLTIAKSDPESFAKSVAQTKIQDLMPSLDINDVQLRILLPLQEMINSQGIQVNTFHNQAPSTTYQKSLTTFVRAILSKWLTEKSKVPEGSLYEPAEGQVDLQELRKMYQCMFPHEVQSEVYAYEETDEQKKRRLLKCLKEDNVEDFKKIYSQYGDVVFEEKIIDFETYTQASSSGGERNFLTVLVASPLKKDILKYCLDNNLLTNEIIQKQLSTTKKQFLLSICFDTDNATMFHQLYTQYGDSLFREQCANAPGSYSLSPAHRIEKSFLRHLMTPFYSKPSLLQYCVKNDCLTDEVSKAEFSITKKQLMLSCCLRKGDTALLQELYKQYGGEFFEEKVITNLLAVSPEGELPTFLSWLMAYKDGVAATNEARTVILAYSLTHSFLTKEVLAKQNLTPHDLIELSNNFKEAASLKNLILNLQTN